MSIEDTYEISSAQTELSEGQKDSGTPSEDRRTDKRRTGDFGETIACKCLERNGYHILERNFFCKLGELDIIAYCPSERVLAFVEVKTRNSIAYGLPSEFVNAKKQRILKRTAEYYRFCNKQLARLQPRMDIFEVLMLDGNVYVKHIKNAF